jgi:hypothetical protein
MGGVDARPWQFTIKQAMVATPLVAGAARFAHYTADGTEPFLRLAGFFMVPALIGVAVGATRKLRWRSFGKRTKQLTTTVQRCAHAIKQPIKARIGPSRATSNKQKSPTDHSQQHRSNDERVSVISIFPDEPSRRLVTTGAAACN